MRGGHHRARGGFTHFASLPFIRNTHRQAINSVQTVIETLLSEIIDSHKLRKASNLLMHLTLGMLNLPDNETKARAVDVFNHLR